MGVSSNGVAGDTVAVGVCRNFDLGLGVENGWHRRDPRRLPRRMGATGGHGDGSSPGAKTAKAVARTLTRSSLQCTKRRMERGVAILERAGAKRTLYLRLRSTGA